jgi:hypothetical protein
MGDSAVEQLCAPLLSADQDSELASYVRNAIDTFAIDDDMDDVRGFLNFVFSGNAHASYDGQSELLVRVCDELARVANAAGICVYRRGQCYDVDL